MSLLLSCTSALAEDDELPPSDDYFLGDYDFSDFDKGILWLGGTPPRATFAFSNGGSHEGQVDDSWLGMRFIPEDPIGKCTVTDRPPGVHQINVEFPDGTSEAQVRFRYEHPKIFHEIVPNLEYTLVSEETGAIGQSGYARDWEGDGPLGSIIPDRPLEGRRVMVTLTSDFLNDWQIGFLQDGNGTAPQDLWALMTMGGTFNVFTPITMAITMLSEGEQISFVPDAGTELGPADIWFWNSFDTENFIPGNTYSVRYWLEP